MKTAVSQSRPAGVPAPENETCDAAAARIQRDNVRRDVQYENWDKLLSTPAFADFLAARGHELRDTMPLLPADLDAERAALGAMLIASALNDVQAVPTGLRCLRPSQFRSQALHAPILRAIGAVYRACQAGQAGDVDVITVGTELRRSGALESVGGRIPASYLTELIEMCPGTANLSAYIDAVQETARLRALYELALRLREAALSHTAQPEFLLTALRGACDAIETKVAPQLAPFFIPDK